jgi:ubiquitin-activating enzyme E1
MTCGGGQYYQNLSLVPIISVIGGIAAQQVINGCSNKFKPIEGYMYYENFACLPEDFDYKKSFDLTQFDSEKIYNPRYYSQIRIFGKDFQRKINQQKYFVVGSGAIGCELLKNFTMIGLGCKTFDLHNGFGAGAGAGVGVGSDSMTELSGSIIVTDMDSIERSNLNRQFLFRNHDIGKSKSEAACNAVRKMNPDINIIAHTNKVCQETTHIYNSKFFEELSGVANALDNVDARKYVDSRCVFYGKSLLESGTLGTKGSTQVIVPHLTESYGASSDPPEKTIPMCTLKHFPYKIEHTIQWARDIFEEMFNLNPQSLTYYLTNRENMAKPESATNDALHKIKNAYEMISQTPSRFIECVQWARCKWEELYHNEIAQLLHAFPPDHLTSEGQRFWSSAGVQTRICPRIIKFDLSNSTHLQFVLICAHLRYQTFGKTKIDLKNLNIEIIEQFLKICVVPEFKPKDDVKIQTDPNAEAKNDSKGKQNMIEDESSPVAEDGLTSIHEDILSYDAKIQECLENLRKKNVELKISPIEFEKDSETNYHVAFITLCSNLRADNYAIENVSQHETKKIAGKIIPAIATTTGVVAGLVTLELFKLVQGHKKMESYRNTFLNLAIPFVNYSEPIKAAVTKIPNTSIEFTQWDFVDFHEQMQLCEIIECLKEKYNMDISMIVYDIMTIYSSFNKKNSETRMKMTIPEIIRSVGRQVPEIIFLMATGSDIADDDIDIEIPSIRIFVKNQEKQLNTSNAMDINQESFEYEQMLND